MTVITIKILPTRTIVLRLGSSSKSLEELIRKLTTLDPTSNLIK